MERYYEQIVVLRVRVSEDEQGGTPSDWNWTELLDLARPDGAEVIAASENLGPNVQPGGPLPTTPEYERSHMASLIAEITSGVQGAMPEQDDFDLADKVLALIENEIND